MLILTPFQRWGWVALLSLWLLAACVAPTASAPQPPEIMYGQELCEACGMLIDEPRFAAATLTTKGEAHKFESIADMVLWHMEHPNVEAQTWFVHDYTMTHWLRAETAYFVVSPDIRAAMPPGVAAFEQKAEAQDLAQQLGTDVLTFDEMRLAVHVAAHGLAQLLVNQ